MTLDWHDRWNDSNSYSQPESSDPTIFPQACHYTDLTRFHRDMNRAILREAVHRSNSYLHSAEAFLESELSRLEHVRSQWDVL